MLTILLSAATVIAVVTALLMRSVAKRATKEAAELASFVALMCIEEDVYRNNSSVLRAWILNNIDTNNVEVGSSFRVIKAATELAANFIAKAGGPAVPLMACLSQMRRVS
jgi:hypothetical protein